MKKLISVVLLGCALMFALACGNQQNSEPARESTPVPSAPISVPPPGGSTTAVINVKSEPPGAAVMLIEEDEGGAGFPQPRGKTPTSLDRVAPGKYTIHLELRGYKSFQKAVEIKGNETVEIDAKLKK